MHYQYNPVDISIITDSHTYDIHPFLSDSPCAISLVESIQKYGIITPPTLIERITGGYDIICGRQRLKGFSTLFPKKKLYCRVLSQSSSPETILTLMLEDQFAKEPLNIIEQAHFSKLCKLKLPDKKRRNLYLKNLPEGRIIKGNQFLEALVNLPVEIQKACFEGSLADKAVKNILRFDKKAQLILLDLLKLLKLGGNNQKKLLEVLFEISQRQDIPPELLILESSISKIVQSKKLSPSQRGEKLFEYLYRQSHPQLSAARDSFDRQVKKLNLPPNISVIPAPAFEMDEVTLAIKFKKFEHLKAAWNVLSPKIDKIS